MSTRRAAGAAAAVLASPADIGGVCIRMTQFGPNARPHLVDHVVGLAGKARAHVWTDGLAELMETDLRHALPRVNVPALVVVGQHDRVTPPTTAVSLEDTRENASEGSEEDTVITDISGVRVGHWTDPIGLTGCTVILCPEGSVSAADARGGAPGTLGGDSLRPGTLIPGAHAFLQTGGSAFGLAAASGVMRWLEERGIGWETGLARSHRGRAVLFDLVAGDPTARPVSESGYSACLAASDGMVAEGSVGAGIGATVGKLPDPGAGMKGGVGTASERNGELVVGAVAAVNSLGRIRRWRRTSSRMRSAAASARRSVYWGSR